MEPGGVLFLFRPELVGEADPGDVTVRLFAAGLLAAGPPARNGVGRARVVLEKLPLLAISAAFSAITLLAQSSGRAVTPLESLPLWARSLNALVVYAVYLRQAFWPVGLAVYYPHPGSKIAWGAIALSATLLLAISVTVVVRVRRDPWLFVGWAWFLGTLVPMIGIVQVGGQERADRYTYFPLIGLCLAVVWLVSELVPMAGRRVVLPAVSFAAFVAPWCAGVFPDRLLA